MRQGALGPDYMWLLITHRRLLMNRDSLHSCYYCYNKNPHGIVSYDYLIMVGCKGETSQLHKLH